MTPKTSYTKEGRKTVKPFSIEYQEPASGPDPVLEIRLGGFLDAHTVGEFESKMDELIKRDYNRLILSLGDLNYISSAGIGAMMVLLQQLRRKSGDLVILGPSPKVYKILD